jgi:hypothetical protein
LFRRLQKSFGRSAVSDKSSSSSSQAKQSSSQAPSPSTIPPELLALRQLVLGRSYKSRSELARESAARQEAFTATPKDDRVKSVSKDEVHVITQEKGGRPAKTSLKGERAAKSQSSSVAAEPSSTQHQPVSAAKSRSSSFEKVTQPHSVQKSSTRKLDVAGGVDQEYFSSVEDRQKLDKEGISSCLAKSFALQPRDMVALIL